MYLKHLSLRQFRNYQEQIVEFTAPKTILVGSNAQGKSNLLEAIELLATLKSHRTSRDRDLISQDSPTGQIQARLSRQYTDVELAIVLRSGSRRTVAVNQQNLRRQLDFLGNLNAVQFSSLDLELVRGGPELRRAWLDSILVQLEPVYAHILQQYQHILRQRNALLKHLANLGAESNPELALWDEQLVTIGTKVARRRARAIDRLAPLAQTWHSAISDRSENLEIIYQPNIPGEDPQQLHFNFFNKIQQRRIPELRQGTTLVGPHRDDILLQIDQNPAKGYASQGQQRTLVLAIKLAELKLIEAVLGEPPLLLLDDVLAELDLHRQNQLLGVIQERFQTVITTTHLGLFDAEWLHSSQILQVNAGKISPSSG
jgi:DNA replication and repair protein RecF